MAILLSVGEVLDDANALSGLEMFSLILLDDIHLIGGRADWQEALFHLINRARVNDCKLIYTANVPAQALDLQLLDLTTRLAQALQFALPNGAHLADRQAVLDAILSKKVGNYLIVLRAILWKRDRTYLLIWSKCYPRLPLILNTKGDACPKNCLTILKKPFKPKAC